MNIRQIAAGTAMAIVVAGSAACGSSSSSPASSSGKTDSSAAGSASGSASTGGTKASAGKSSAAKGVKGLFQGIDLCKALTPESLTALGLQPSESKQYNEKVSSDPGCTWGSEATTMVALYSVLNEEASMADGETKINLLGYPGITDHMYGGNSCMVTMQVGKDELEVQLVLDSGNAALKDKGCDTALDLTKQVLGKVKK